jgi:bifunctional non-homologous end joining protein LigD
MDEAAGSLEPLLGLAGQDEAAGLPDAPWPPHYDKQAGEPPRVQPSKRRAAAPARAGGPAARPGTPAGNQQPARKPPAGNQQPARKPATGNQQPARKPVADIQPTGRRRSTMPLIEVARAATKDEAMAGLERWQERHAAVWPYLEPADVLVDSMRGRSSTWTRIRLNLRHVPEAERPPQEELEVDYDPWASGGRPG